MHRVHTALSAALALVLGVGAAPALLPSASAAPVGQGFNLNASDLRFVLKQIKIAERHADTRTAEDPCGTLLGSGPDQIPDVGQGVELPWGLRTVDGTCNNLVAGKATVGAADRRFPRLVSPVFKPAERGPSGAGTSYQQTAGSVYDSQPRVVSNLVVDQTASNPAAVEAAGEDAEVTASGAFVIPNVAPDVGLSAPYNSWFTLFGQFFDHGLDLVGKGGRGTVFVPLKPDDPLFNPAPGAPNFMVLTRATHDGDHEATNATSTFVDQSQTYTSHPSHQVFLREYADDADGKPQPTGRLLTGPGGGMADWAAVKEQARTVLGIELRDADVLRLPLLATDPYGRFERGPNGYPQLVVPTAPGGLVEGDPAAPVLTTGAAATGHAFLDDIAHNATPSGTLTPDTDEEITGASGRQPAGTYDDEMLDAHFMAGDGRVNENIGLTAVHHVFHSEHNRLADEIDELITNDPSFTPAERADWRATDRYTARDGGWTYEERLFQAARFVTEMEYQHLAFEEFVRKVQPLVNPFGEGGTGYNTSIDPAITAEFAHAVYRFGHSMLNESVDRVRADGSRDDIELLDAFLNPPSFLAGGRTPEQAAGDIVRGMTRQVGNELDEFVTEALRNRLLGLPLDLATLNMARARETGVPTLNAARRAFYAESNNSALAPYQSWADFGFSIKHPASLINFIAAYGTHPSITSAGTAAGRRAAANALVLGVPGPDGELGTADDLPDAPEDGYAFLNSTVHETTAPDGTTTPGHSDWVSAGDGVTTTGVDTIDLWMGGLAEKQMVFGGLLGPTFNYVFEDQMEDLQFGDRFYYLSRTAGLNMLTQLEGNSFAELISRNTDVSGLPADSFSRPDLTFDLAQLGTTGPVRDDPATTYNETALLSRMPDGTIRYGGPAHVVFNGTAGRNRVWSSEGDDTIRGNDGDDWMQGGDGNDNHIGGLGDDILLDSAGDDVLKGGDGNDTLSSGQGFGGDLNQGGRGNDFIVTGNDMTESFAGPGDDFVTGGAGDDTVFGDDGDDWIESGATVTGTGGGAFNLLQGDNGAPFQDDPNEPGHDVLMGYGGETDYDSEGGDDVMLLGPGIQRSEGMLGFDYATHESDPAPADSDLDFTGALPPSVETNVDRFDLVEALSGWNRDDVLRGDDRDAAAMEGHELTAAGIARVEGLAALLPAGATSFTGGNILLGGAGSDTIEGRGGDDVIDGDVHLDVHLSVRDAATGATELERVETMRGVQARVLAGTINPGQLRIVRQIQRPANGTSVDTAVFSGASTDYTITATADGTLVVDSNGGLDGVDRVRNVERLQFADATITVAAPAAPAIGTASPGVASATARWAAPAANGSPAVTGYLVQPVDPTTLAPIGAARPAAAGATSLVVTGLANDTPYAFTVAATNRFGTGPASAVSNTVVPAAVTGPSVAVLAPASGATGVAVGTNVTARFSAPVSGVSTGTNSTNVVLRSTATGVRVPAAVSYSAVLQLVPGAASLTVNPTADLAPGTSYTVTVTGAANGLRATAGGAPVVTTSWSFTTLSTVNVAPRLTGQTPAAGAVNVNRDSSVTATFSEPVVGVSAATARVERVNDNGSLTAVAVTVTYNAGTRTVTLDPVGRLNGGRRFRVTLTGGPGAIREAAPTGLPLPTAVWTFGTA